MPSCRAQICSASNIADSRDSRLPIPFRLSAPQHMHLSSNCETQRKNVQHSRLRTSRRDSVVDDQKQLRNSAWFSSVSSPSPGDMLISTTVLGYLVPAQTPVSHPICA